MSSPDTSLEPLSVTIAAFDPSRQLQSPLFTTLHPEVRNMIFRLALSEYDDLTLPYGKHEFYYRPGFQFAPKIDTNLLLTCRIVYLETHLLPIALNEHVFWYESQRGPPRRTILDHHSYFTRMTPQQRAAVRRVRFFTQLTWLENRVAEIWPVGLAVRKLAITIRHSDWWWWEVGEDLRIEEPSKGWGAWAGSIGPLEELKLELESIEDKREQLEERVGVATGWTFPLTAGGSLVHNGQEAAKSTWMGTARMSPHKYGDDSDEEVWDPDNDSDTYESDGNGNGRQGGSDSEDEDEEVFTEKEDLLTDRNAMLDSKYDLDLILHVRKLKFMPENPLV